MHHASRRGAETLRRLLQGGRGSSACRAEGTGALRDVRIINLLQDTLFWFRVDSRVPGHVNHSLSWGGFKQGSTWREPMDISSSPVDQVPLQSKSCIPNLRPFLLSTVVASGQVHLLVPL